jgi:hypothetical protein
VAAPINKVRTTFPFEVNLTIVGDEKSGMTMKRVITP